MKSPFLDYSFNEDFHPNVSVSKHEIIPSFLSNKATQHIFFRKILLNYLGYLVMTLLFLKQKEKEIKMSNLF